MECVLPRHKHIRGGIRAREHEESQRRSQDPGRTLEARQGDGGREVWKLRKGLRDSAGTVGKYYVRSSENQTFSVGFGLDLVLGVRIHQPGAEYLRLRQ